MALDRQTIERKDFPVGRRGYDPEAVDAHLVALADEIADYKRSARRRSDTLAASASEQVRAIVEAAEATAANIQREADTEAREIRNEANSEAQATREQAHEYIGKVSESTGSMLTRLSSMESELGALIETLRTGSHRLSADLQLLEGNLSEVGEVMIPRPRFESESEPTAESGPEPVAAVQPEVAEEHRAVIAPSDESQAPEHTNGGASGPLGDADAPDDAEGARLIALNMALNGTVREETSRYLSENFTLSDRDSLLDEVYASVEP